MVFVMKERYRFLQNRLAPMLICLDRFASAHQTALFWVGAILYKFALDAMYIWAVSPQYAYAGMVYAPSFFKYCVASVLYLLLFAVLPKREKDTAAFLLHLQFAFTVAPMLSFYALAGQSSRYMLMVFLCVLLQIWIVFRGKEKLRPVSITGIQNYATVMLGILLLFTVLIPVLYNGFHGLKAFDFSYIYTMRANAAYPPGFGYILDWVTKAVLPFGFLYALLQRRYPLAALIAVFQVLLYMETGIKFILFIFLPITLVFLLSKSGHLLKLLYAGFFLLCAAVVFGYQLDQGQSGLGITLTSLAGIRAIFIPAYNKFLFYECFSVYPHTYFSDGMIGKMLSLTYPYGGSLGQVAYAFEGGEFMGSNSNTGYLGEAYAQMGFLGMLLMSVLLALVLRGLRSYGSKENFPLITALFSVYFIILNDGALFTTLFSGGMFIAFLLVFIYFGKHSEDTAHGIQCL